MRQLILDFSPGKPSMASFVSGGNSELVHALREMLRGGERMLYLWGEEGCGKSHLLASMVEEAREAGFDAVHFSCAADSRFETESRFVAVDDVENLDDAGQVSLFHLYNRLKEGGGMLLASGKRPPSGMDIRPELSTRLGWGLVYQVHALTDEDKRCALRAHSRSRGFEIPQEVVEYLMHHVRRDLPTLMRMLDALDEYSMETRRSVTIPLLKEIIHLQEKDK